jgi:hypothetical protein
MSAFGLLCALVAAAGLKGWVNFFHNPYLTDGVGLLGLSAGASAFLLDSLWLALVVAFVAPWFRETAAVASFAWLGGKRRWVCLLCVGLTVAVLVKIHSLPGMPKEESAFHQMLETYRVKGPVKILGDVFAAYHALWLTAIVGFRLAPRERRRSFAIVGLTLLGASFGMAVIAENTIRLLTFALPFVFWMTAELFSALEHRSRAWALGLAAALGVGGVVWHPMRPWGNALSAHRGLQFVFGILACFFVFLVMRGPLGVRAAEVET